MEAIVNECDFCGREYEEQDSDSDMPEQYCQAACEENGQSQYE